MGSVVSGPYLTMSPVPAIVLQPDCYRPLPLLHLHGFIARNHARQFVICVLCIVYLECKEADVLLCVDIDSMK